MALRWVESWVCSMELKTAEVLEYLKGFNGSILVRSLELKMARRRMLLGVFDGTSVGVFDGPDDVTDFKIA